MTPLVKCKYHLFLSQRKCYNSIMMKKLTFPGKNKMMTATSPRKLADDPKDRRLRQYALILIKLPFRIISENGWVICQENRDPAYENAGRIEKEDLPVTIFFSQNPALSTLFSRRILFLRLALRRMCSFPAWYCYIW